MNAIKDTIRDKVAEARRSLRQTSDPAVAESLRIRIEELEGRILLEMSEGPPK